MMRRDCDRVQEQMESWETTPPDWARAHIAGCSRCREAWHWEQRYRRALHHARHTPVPACSLSWERVQAQLAARAVRQRTLRWRFVFATTFAAGFAAIALIALLLVNRDAIIISPTRIAQLSPSEAPTSTHPSASRAIAKAEGTFPILDHPAGSNNAANKTQREAQKPAATAPSIPLEKARRTTENKPEAYSYGQADRTVVVQLSWQGGQPVAGGTAPEPAEPAATLLPLPSMTLESGQTADYLPVQYGGDESHAYSF
jgi:hypothetical protein